MPGCSTTPARFSSGMPGPITMGELSRDLEVPLSTATRTMDWLVNNGYAQRLPIQKIAGVVRVELTGKGKETFQAISTFMLGKVEQAMNPLNNGRAENFYITFEQGVGCFEQAG